VSTILSVEGLSAGYGDSGVLSGVALSVASGEVVAVLGPNGAGKTTLLLTLAGILAPTVGRVQLAGADVTNAPAHVRARQGLVHVPDDRGIWSGLSVADHFRVGPYGATRDIDFALGYMPALRPLMSRRAGVLSGGEQQMLALARALSSRPSLLMIDELSHGLAPIIVQRILPAVREYADANGAGVLLVEQQAPAALAVADRVCVIARGRITIDGPASDLRDDDDLLSASYLGGAALEETQRPRP
jgi:branched-chain amino acid transport system ATP-binding protein